MALVNINHVTVLDNPTSFTNPFQFEVTFECLQELKDGIYIILILLLLLLFIYLFIYYY